MVAYSHSRISTFEQCRLKYKYQYIDRIKVDIPTTIEAHMGSAVHHALYILYQELSKGNVLSEKELINIYEDAWQKDWDPNILIAKHGHDDRMYLVKGRSYISRYYAIHSPFDRLETLGLETQDYLRLNNKDSYHIRIDRLARNNESYFVIDYKTNNRAKTQSEINEDKQLAMYSLWVKEKYDASDVRLVWHFLTNGTTLTSIRKDDELLSLKEEILDKISIIESADDYPPNPSGLCPYCVFKEICPAMNINSIKSEHIIIPKKIERQTKLNF
ncbi:MAG: RecB family exonuclease [Candidatus Woesearchaeota archaeon]